MSGRFYEDFEPGQTIVHALTRTVTETDNILFSTMTLNPQPLHIDRHFAEATEWGQPLVNSLFTLGLMIGISVHDTTLGTLIANLGMTDVKFPHPLFQGDTVHVTTDIVMKREFEVAAECRDRRVRTQGFQSERCPRGRVPPPGLYEEASELIHAFASLLARRCSEEA